jgi:hypothetical protein
MTIVTAEDNRKITEISVCLMRIHALQRSKAGRRILNRELTQKWGI